MTKSGRRKRPDPLSAASNRGSSNGTAGSMPASSPLYDPRTVPSRISIDTSPSDRRPLKSSARAIRPPPVKTIVAAAVPVPST